MPEPIVVTRKESPPVRRACGKCGRLGHLQRTCNSPEKAHLKVGIEVEGYWQRPRWSEVQREAAKWHMDGITDGSLSRHADYESYEWRTRPGSLGEAINQLVAVYPDATDKKVGMHVHVSFNDSDSSLLATQQFFDYFDAEWRAWGATKNLDASHWFYRRLDGENDYCKRPNIGGMNKRHIANMDRYSQLNFSSMSQHRTVECRLLPMFRDVKIGVSAVEKLVDIYESWLSEGKCDTFLSSCNKRVEVSAKDESSQVTREIIMPPTIDKQGFAREVSVYSEPRRLPGYTVLHAGTARATLANMGVL